MNDSFFDGMDSNFDFGVDFLSSSIDDLLEGTSSNTTAAATVVIDDEINNFLIIDNKSKSTIYKDTSDCKCLQHFMQELNPTEQ